MAMMTMLFRKMIKNRWLVLSMLVGMILCTALTSSMPLYKDAILQRMLVKDMEKYYSDSGKYPGHMIATVNPGFSLDKAKQQGPFIEQFDAYWDQIRNDEQQLTFLDYIKIRETASLTISPVDPLAINADVEREITLNMRSGIQDHVRLIDGRFPESVPVDGVYEALVTDSALVQLNMVLNNEFAIANDATNEPIVLKPVGVIAEHDLNDLYWNQSNLTRYSKAFILDEKLFEEHIVHRGIVPIRALTWVGSIDYNDFDFNSAFHFMAIKTQMESFYKSNYASSFVSQPAEATLLLYKDREATLNSLLWMLNVPLYVLIAYYMYMVSSLLLDRQRTEIALLRSRGASRLIITMLYAVELVILAGFALVVGPFIGMFFTSILGSSDSFLGFVQRKMLHVELSLESYLFSAVAAGFALLINIIPVILATKHSIVDQKGQNVRQERSSVWHKFGLDVILLGCSIYGLYSFRKRLDDIIALGLDSQSLSADPLLFVVPSMFIIGLAFLLLRAYPYVVKTIYWLGKSVWSPSLYSSFLLVGRRSKHYHTLMIFLILTIGTGIYNASAARTLNGNAEDQIWYHNGADIVLRQHWANDALMLTDGQGGMIDSDVKINYREPDYEVFNFMPGVEQAARVFTNNTVSFTSDNTSGTTRLMGIDTYEFGQVAWMKEGLLPYHLNEYLNLIANDRHAVLISRDLADQYEIEAGDSLSISWGGNTPIVVTAYGLIDYFPSFNPNPSRTEEGSKGPSSGLIVGHLATLQNEASLEPYDVWIRMASSEGRHAFYRALEDGNIPLEWLTDTYEAIYDSRNDPFRMAMNGVLSLGFILSLMVTFIGFLLFWMLSLQARVLQMGIFRAMGISFRQTVVMLGMEQLLTSGAGLLLGLLGGSLASLLFVPLFQLSFDPGQIVPPFKVVMEVGDMNHLIVNTVAMLGIALIALAWMLKRINIHQAVKLGED